MVLHSCAFHLKVCSIQNYDYIIKIQIYRCLVGVASEIQTNCKQPINTKPLGNKLGYMSTYLAEVMYGKNCLIGSQRATSLVPQSPLHHLHQFQMHEEVVLCECIFLDVSVTISKATSTLVYESPRREAVFTLVFEFGVHIWKWMQEKTTKCMLLKWWSNLAHCMFLSYLACIARCKIRD